jgi:hypothetical protein
MLVEFAIAVTAGGAHHGLPGVNDLTRADYQLSASSATDYQETMSL